MPRRRAALYIRVSSAAQVDNSSLQEQERVLRDYCRRTDLEVAGVYRDAGVSGSTVADRPAIRALLEDGRGGRFDRVLIYKVDRFTRADPWDLYPLVKGLMDLNIQLTSATESFDLSDDNGQLIFSILANFAARERRLIVQRTTLGKRARAQDGRFTGGTVPFGYAVDPATGRFVPDETPWWGCQSAAEVVRLIFVRYLELGGAPGVARWLVEEGVPAPRRVWNPSTVREIVRNPVYRGDFAWGRRSHRLHQPSRRTAPEEWVLRPEAHPPLVPRDLWDRCAQAMEARRRGGRRPAGSPPLLSGLLACARCGSSLTPRRWGQRLGYTCASRYNAARRREGTACRQAPTWPARALESLLWPALRELLLSDAILERLSRATGDCRAALRRAEQALAQAQRERAEVAARQARLLDLALSGRYPAELLRAKEEELTRWRERAEAALQAAERRLAEARARLSAVPEGGQVAARLRSLLEAEASWPQRRALLQAVLAQRIAVGEDGTVRLALRPPLRPVPG